MRYSIKLTAVTVTWLVAWGLTLACGVMIGKKWGIAEGRNIATKEVLHANPPSEELEMVCAGLWIGEQNKKYWSKENAGRSK